MKTNIKTIDDLKKFLETYQEKVLQNSIITLQGNLGSGKTELVKQLIKMREKHQNIEVSSPTFSLVNEYIGEKNTYYHMDFYRIKSIHELHEIGIYEYLDSENHCFIEWPEPLMNLLKSYKYTSIYISNNEERTIEVSFPEPTE